MKRFIIVSLIFVATPSFSETSRPPIVNGATSGANGTVPLTPYDFQVLVHKRVIEELQGEKYRRNDGSVDYGYMGQFFKMKDPQPAKDAFVPFRNIIVETAKELRDRNQMDPIEAQKIAQRAVFDEEVMRDACKAGSSSYQPKPPVESEFAKEFDKTKPFESTYAAASDPVVKTVARSVVEATGSLAGGNRPDGATVDERKLQKEQLREKYGLRPDREICDLSAPLMATLKDSGPIERMQEEINNGNNPPVEVPPATGEETTNPPRAVRPEPMTGSTRELTRPILRDEVIRTEVKPTAEPRPENTGAAEEGFVAAGPATHRGVASHPTDLPPATAIKREERLSPEVVDSIIRQTINDKLLTRDLDRRSADELTERLSSAYKREGDLTAAFAQVQKELTQPATATAKTAAEERPADGNSRVSAFSGSAEEALLKEFAGADLKDTDNKTGPTLVGIGPAAGLVTAPGANGAGDTNALTSGTQSALSAKNALKWDEEVKVPNPTSTAGVGGGSLADGKASSFGGDSDGSPGGALGTLVADGKPQRPTLQTVKGRIQSFLDAVAKTFKPRSLAGGALRGLASVEPTRAENAHGEDETTLALASFGESSGEWTGTGAPNLWIPIGFFLGAFGATLGAFLGWQRWRNRKSTHRS